MKGLTSIRLRLLVMFTFLVVVAVGYFTAGGIGNFCGFGFDAVTLLCPLGALLAMLAEKTAIPLSLISIAVVLAGCIVLGKVFCAWGCPVHFMSALTKRLRPPNAHRLRTQAKGAACSSCERACGKRRGVKLDSRHGILAAGITTTLIFGFPVFCLVCPVGLTFATVLLVMRLFAFGDTSWTVVVFPLIILVELLVVPRWCKNFCPLGALLSLFSGLNKTLRPSVDTSKCLRTTQCISCNLCERACHEGINLHDVAAGQTTLNDCSKCRACSDSCPTGAISFPFLPKQTRHGAAHEKKEPSCHSSQT